MSSHARSGVGTLDVFVVRGTVDGRPRQSTTSSPASAGKTLANWLQADPSCGRPGRLSWTTEPDAAPVVFAAWLADGHRDGQLRVDHLFGTKPGEAVGPRLTSLCGLEFSWHVLEFAVGLGPQSDHGCLSCLRLVPGLSQVAGRAGQQSVASLDWNGWDDYYRALGWPVAERDGQLILQAAPDAPVVALVLPVDLGEDAQEVLADTGAQAPALVVPTLPHELVFVVRASDERVPVPREVRVLTSVVPLVPSSTRSGEVSWFTSPDQAVDAHRCLDAHLLAVLRRLLSLAAERHKRSA